MRAMPLSRRHRRGHRGHVTDNCLLPGTHVLQVLATDQDDMVNSNNGIVFYSILRQTPGWPQPHMFAINPSTGAIFVTAAGLVAQVSPRPPQTWLSPPC